MCGYIIMCFYNYVVILFYVVIWSYHDVAEVFEHIVHIDVALDFGELGVFGRHLENLQKNQRTCGYVVT